MYKILVIYSICFVSLVSAVESTAERERLAEIGAESQNEVFYRYLAEREKIDIEVTSYWDIPEDGIVSDKNAIFKSESASCFSVVIGESYLFNLKALTSYREMVGVWSSYKIEKITQLHKDYFKQDVSMTGTGWQVSESRATKRQIDLIFRSVEYPPAYADLKNKIDNVVACLYVRKNISPERQEFRDVVTDAVMYREYYSENRFLKGVRKRKEAILKSLIGVNNAACTFGKSTPPVKLIDLVSKLDAKPIYSRNMKIGYDSYHQDWSRKVEGIRKIFYPSSTSKGENVFAITLDPEGGIIDIDVVGDAVNDILYREIVLSVCASAPFSPIPGEIIENLSRIVLVKYY